MAQTTGSISQGIWTAEVSTNGSSWTNISGQAGTVTPSGGDQLTGTQHTAEGSAPVVVGSNKIEATQAEVRILYTETNGEAFRIVKAAYDGANKVIYFRYAPKGNTTGNKRYLAANDAGSAFPCPIVNCMPPTLDAGSGDPAMASFTIIFPKWLEETIA
jgi:hypothetical protein